MSILSNAGDRAEAGGVHDDVEVVVAGGRLDAVCGDPHDRRVLQRHEFDIVPVVRLEIVGLERQALERETVVGRDQLLGDLGIVDPTSDAVGDVVREFLIGSLVEVDLGIVRADDREARPCVELIPERSTFLGRGLPEPPSRNMLEATDGGRTVLEDLRVRRRISAISSSVIDRLLSGLLQLGRRWKTVRCSTTGAIDGTIWIPVAPVPI